MLEDLSDDRRLFYGSDDLHGATTVGTEFDVDIEYPFEQPCPAHTGRTRRVVCTLQIIWFMQLDCEHFRELANHRTLRFELAGRRYFLKVHYGVGWCEILKNLLQSKVPVLGARNEWRAIQRLQTLGVETMNLVGYGERGMNPTRRQSFVITDALENMISLADFCAGWELTHRAQAPLWH